MRRGVLAIVGATVTGVSRPRCKLRSIAGDLERLVSAAKANQATMERLGDDVSRATLELAKLQKRVQASEEWQGSVDGFRRQVNKSLLQLRDNVSQLQNPPP